MPRFSPRLPPLGRAAPFVLAAALQAACAAWPCAALAQRSATGASSAAASDRQDDSLSSAVRRGKSDEQRLLGAPRTSGNPYSANPYSSDGASPDDARDALTNEKHMRIVTPSDYYATSGASATGGGRSDASGNGRRVTGNSRIGANGISRAGNAMTKGSGARGHQAATAGYDYGASQTSPTAQVYGNPYSNPYGSPEETNAELYKSPW
ncbi:hypothetical protein [Paraburkholderia lycopersici]|uniref:Lipoprotein n=1 Tax=Paraburkholderia lycopersici TaxID=416944 RepID=A0A1G6GNQ4_9BURK|nr:hypothetical protein [Paraburkholderia lycopersici]SDB83385.1 hypothetical protein SAMN05421548_101122 [Paraburkholderia lycopersici]